MADRALTQATETRPRGEPPGGGSDAQAVFLSPRVIDKAAFEGYGALLRELLAETSGQAALLRAAAEQGRQTQAELTELGAKNKDQLELAAKLLRTLNQRTAEAEAMLAKSAEMLGAAARFEQESERLVGAKASALEKRLTATLDTFSRRLQAGVEAGAREMNALLEEMKTARDSIKRQADAGAAGGLAALRETCDRAERLAGFTCEQMREGPGAAPVPSPGSLGDLVNRAADTAEAFARAEGSLRSITGSLGDAAQELERTLAQQSEIEAGLVRAAEGAREAEQSLNERASEAVRLFKLIGEVRRGAEETAARLAAATKGAEAALDDRSHAAAEVRRQVRQIEEVMSTIEPWRGVLLENALDGSIPEPIARLIAGIRDEISADVQKMAAAMSLIAGRASGGGARSIGPSVVVRRRDGSIHTPD